MSEDIFKPKQLTIHALFNDADSFYQIPRYQRPYSWGDEQLEKLWDDLIEAYENDDEYFLGSIITAKASDSANYLDIVDGQQRLTTLMILLCVYRDLFPDINLNLISDDPFAIDKGIIEMSIRYRGVNDRLRLRTHTQHESDFQKTILNPGATQGYNKPYKKDLKKEEDPKFKFINTSVFFSDKLSDIGMDMAGNLLNYIFRKVRIIRIDCKEVGFAIKLFQVLNARGLDLSNSDLIKSFMIGQIHKKYADNQDMIKHYEDRFMDDWKYCENIALDTDETMNDLFVLYEYYLLEDNPKRALYDELVNLITNNDPNETIADFKQFAIRYKKDIYYNDDKNIFPFWYIRWSTYWRTILLASLHSNYSNHAELIYSLRRYYYLNWIAGNTLTRIKQTSFNLIKWVKTNRPHSEIVIELEKNLKENNTIQRAIDSLNGDIYNEIWCKPLLYWIEYNQQEKPQFYSYGDRDIHVEHILPQSFEKKEEWHHFANYKYIEDWVNSGGNLTLLSGKKNIAASNKGFDEKIKAYDGAGFHDIDDTKVTSFRITQFIVNDYNANKFAKEWNSEALEARWRWFCSQMEDLLDLDLSSIKDTAIE